MDQKTNWGCDVSGAVSELCLADCGRSGRSTYTMVNIRHDVDSLVSAERSCKDSSCCVVFSVATQSGFRCTKRPKDLSKRALGNTYCFSSSAEEVDEWLILDSTTGLEYEQSPDLYDLPDCRYAPRPVYIQAQQNKGFRCFTNDGSTSEAIGHTPC